MAYSQKLEELIDAALADGVLEESEKRVLFKRAEAEGIDLDEFNMVLNSRLQKLEIEKAGQKKSNKRGTVRQCPNCGAVVNDYAVKCTQCGYEFGDVEANSKMTEFANQLQKLTQKYASAYSIDECDERDSAIGGTIRNFPISNSKKDLLEFLGYAISSIDSSSGAITSAWKMKIEDCFSRVRLYHNGDTDFAILSQEWKKKNTFGLKWRAMSSSAKFGLGLVTFLIASFALLCMIV